MTARICICDDDPVAGSLLSLDLRAAGFEVDEPLTSVEAAIGYFSVSSPDLLLLDLNRPRGGGLELLGYLRMEGLLSATRVVMLTSETDVDLMDRAKRLGAVGHLVKPVDGERLAARVSRVLDDPGLRWIEDLAFASASPEPAARAGDATLAPAPTRQRLEDLNPVVAELALSYGQPAVEGLLRALLSQLSTLEATTPLPGPLEQAAHAIKGAAASLGFTVVSNACSDLEAACRTGTAAAPQLARAAAVCESAKVQISEMLRKAA